MKNYKFIYQNNKIEFIASNIKYIHFSTNEEYWCFKQCINYYKRKMHKSEFSVENHSITRIEIDGEEIAKETEIYIIDMNINFDEDIGLTSKSLIFKYLGKIASNIELEEEFQQIKTMLSLLANMLSNENLVFIPREFNNKSITKFVDASLFKDGLFANSFDLTYQEYIDFYTYILKEIIDIDKNNIVIFEINLLTKEHLTKIEELSKNCIVFVVFNQSNVKLDNNFYIEGYDFENDNDLYERMENTTNYYNLEDYKKSIKDKKLKNIYYQPIEF